MVATQELSKMKKKKTGELEEMTFSPNSNSDGTKKKNRKEGRR